LNAEPTTARLNPWTFAIIGVGVLFAYLWLVIDVPQLHHNWLRAFLLGRTFLVEFTDYAGGPIEYASRFLVQLLTFQWTGVMLVGAMSLALYGLTRWLIRRYTARRCAIIALVPPFLMLVLVQSHAYTAPEPLFATLVALCFVGLYLYLPLTHGLARVPIFIVAAVVLFYLTGGALLLFVLLCCLHELLSRRRLAGGIILVAGLVIPYVSSWLPYLETVLVYEPDLLQLYLRNAPFEHRDARTLDTLIVLCSYAGLWLFFPIAFCATKLGSAPRQLAAKLSAVGVMLRAASILIVLALVAAPVYQRLTWNHWTRVERLMDEQRWDDALSAISVLRYQNPPTSLLTSHLANRALAHTGRSGEEMFRYPQYNDSRMSESPNDDSVVLLLDGALLDPLLPRIYNRRSDIYFDIAMVNRSERWAQEAMTVQLYTAELLKRQMLIFLAKGDLRTGRAFLSSAAKMLFPPAWVADYQQKLSADPTLANDPQVSQLRASILRIDYVGDYLPEQRLTQCLEANPKNRMAFELLMARYLLTRQLGKFASQLRRLDQFDYQGIPRHYEEALLSYLHATAENPQVRPDLGPLLKRRRIRKDTNDRLQAFVRIYATYQDDDDQDAAMQAAWAQLAPEFGDTYWFFDVFGRSAAAPPPGPAPQEATP
jgi:hypothetical protein